MGTWSCSSQFQGQKTFFRPDRKKNTHVFELILEKAGWVPAGLLKPSLLKLDNSFQVL